MYHLKIYILICILALLHACQNPHTEETQIKTEQIEIEQKKQAVIYGEDNRQDLYEVADDNPFKRLALKSIAALVQKRNIVYDDPNDIRFSGSNFGRSYRLCDDEPFRNQPMISSCSGTLIEDDLLVTAGHCVEDQSSCNELAFVFGYYMDDPQDRAIIPRENIFYCQKLQKQFLNLNVDYAFIKLDRPVNRDLFEPAPLPPDLLHPTPLNIGDEVTLIGFPSGIPMKYAPGGKITAPRDTSNNFFKATVDSYGGNSGSGVFNALGQQIGILVRGEEDFAWDRLQGCNRSNRLDENRTESQRAEEITRLQRAIEELCQSGYQSERLCAGYTQSWCHACESDTDCLTGWRCQEQSGFMGSPRFCASPCDENLRCRMDHECIEGYCEPQIIEQGCYEDQVAKINRCGQMLESITQCNEMSFCREGQCYESKIGDTCDSAIDLQVVSQSFNVDMREGFDDNLEVQCINRATQNINAGIGSDMVYRFELTEPNRLVATATGFNTLLSLRSSCEMQESEITCNDDSASELQSQVRAQLEAGTYYLIIDSVQSTSGEMRLDIDFCDHICDLGDLKCDGQGVYECRYNADGCLSWQLNTACGPLEICENLSCVPAQQGDLCLNPFYLSPVDQSISQNTGLEFHLENAQNSCNTLYSENLVDFFYGFNIDHPQSLKLAYQGNIGSLSILKDCGDEVDIDAQQKACLSVEGGITIDLQPGRYQVKINAEAQSYYLLQFTFSDSCENPCQQQALSQCTLDQRAVEGCMLDEKQCLHWQVITSCLDDEICLNGACVDRCEIEGCVDMDVDMGDMGNDVGMQEEYMMGDASVMRVDLLLEEDAFVFQEQEFRIKARESGCRQYDQGGTMMFLLLILLFRRRFA